MSHMKNLKTDFRASFNKLFLISGTDPYRIKDILIQAEELVMYDLDKYHEEWIKDLYSSRKLLATQNSVPYIMYKDFYDWVKRRCYMYFLTKIVVLT